MQKDQSTEEKIIAAAKEIFVQKGFAGARMQDIADRGGINKALLHYYFRTKEQLFEKIFDEVFHLMMPRLNAVLTMQGNILAKIDAFVDEYIRTIRQNPHIPLFVIHELSQEPDRFVQKITQNPNLPNIAALLMELLQAMEEGKIRQFPPIHLILNILSMCVFPFVAKPIFRAVTRMDEALWEEMLDERAVVVKQFIRAALEIKTH